MPGHAEVRTQEVPAPEPDLTQEAIVARARALLLNARSYKSVAAILRNGKDRAAAAADAPILFHPNIRGRDYYN